MKQFALYTTFNDNYIEMGSNMIFSFLYNNPWFNGDIIILCDKGEYCGLNADNRNLLLSIYDKIIFKDDCYELYKDCVDNAIQYANNKGTMMCYYKAELCKKDEYQIKLYLDPDIIVNNNIQELFTHPEFKNAATADIGVFVHEKGGNRINEMNLQIDKMHKKQSNEYFNCGMILINNDYISDDLYEKFINLSKTFNRDTFKHPLSQKGELVDQDIFNEILENVIIIPFIYQFTSFTLNYINIAKIIHYCGNYFKPTKINEIRKNDERLKAYDIYYRYNYLKNNKY